MAKTFACADVGVPCDWQGKAETEQELFQKIGDHASSVHGFNEVPPELLDKIRASVKDE